MRTTIKLSECFKPTGESERMLSRAFAWLTRIGAGRKFGSLPISWYQMHQCNCITILQERAANEVRCKGGNVQTRRNSRWQTVMSTIELFQSADNRTRTTCSAENYEYTY